MNDMKISNGWQRPAAGGAMATFYYSSLRLPYFSSLPSFSPPTTHHSQLIHLIRHSGFLIRHYYRRLGGTFSPKAQRCSCTIVAYVTLLTLAS
jgi:hypothetical protein